MLEHIERLRTWRALNLAAGIERQLHQNRLLKIAREGGQITSADLMKLEPKRRYATLIALAVEGTATVTAAGIKKLEQSLSLQVGQNAVLNPALTPGAVTEQITVTEDVVQLATYDNPAISSTLENDRINQLPINGRNLTTLTGLTTPGLEGTRANGLLGQALEFVHDGAPLSNRNIGGATRLPDPDAVQEVRVETANSSAQFATPATGIITTKSGTNAFHGSAFETARNNYIGTAKARQDRSNLAAPHLVRNEFGASIGGPILIPHLHDGRNRSFFFVAFERLSFRQNVSLLTFVPTVAMRNGDFSGLVNSSGQLQTLYDNQTSNPATYLRTAFPIIRFHSRA